MQRAAYVKRAGAGADLPRSERALDAPCHCLLAQRTRKEEKSTDVLHENERGEAPKQAFKTLARKRLAAAPLPDPARRSPPHALHAKDLVRNDDARNGGRRGQHCTTRSPGRGHQNAEVVHPVWLSQRRPKKRVHWVEPNIFVGK